MQMKKKFKNEKGSVAILVVGTLFAFYLILVGVYARTSYVRKSQLMADLALKSYYEKDVIGLIENSKNSGFAWKIKYEKYDKNENSAMLKIDASDYATNVKYQLLTANQFNGNYKIGYINDTGKIEKNEQYKNSIYTDFIATEGKSNFICSGLNKLENAEQEKEKITWVGYDKNGNFKSKSTGEKFVLSDSEIKYVRVLWKYGIVKKEVGNICITSGVDNPTYVSPSNKIKVLVGNTDVTNEVNLTVYINENKQNGRYSVEIRDIPSKYAGKVKIHIAEKTISGMSDGKRIFNYDNKLTTKIEIKVK